MKRCHLAEILMNEWNCIILEEDYLGPRKQQMKRPLGKFDIYKKQQNQWDHSREQRIQRDSEVQKWDKKRMCGPYNAK